MPSPPNLRRRSKIVSSIEYIVYREEGKKKRKEELGIQKPYSYRVSRIAYRVKKIGIGKEKQVTSYELRVSSYKLKEKK